LPRLQVHQWSDVLSCWQPNQLDEQGTATVAISSTKAEYMAISEAVKQALYINQLHAPLLLNEMLPIILHVDNTSAIAVAQSENHYNARMKHLDTCI